MHPSSQRAVAANAIFRRSFWPSAVRQTCGRITSYSLAEGGNVVNEVAYAYDPWGNVESSWQEHAGTATKEQTAQSPQVDYTYEDAAVCTAAQYVRLKDSDSATGVEGWF